LLKKYEPRLFFSVFGETHAAGHAFWRFQDPDQPGYVRNGDMESALLETYQAVDRALAEVVEGLPRDTVLVILSSQGFSLDSIGGEQLLAEILVRIGMSSPRRDTLNYAYAPYAPALALDMSRTRAFCLPTDLQGYIRVNLQGREPQGVVSESEYDALCCELENELLALRDSTHKTPVVDHIVRVRDLYPGDRSGALPDLSVVWNNDHVMTGVESTRLGGLQRNPDLTGGGGNHRGPGFMILYGPGVVKRRFTGHVFDVARTVSCLLGEASRPEWDGGVCRFHG
jgi:predicted AlkP superfamily phosphohydrolase/phosphomutase